MASTNKRRLNLLGVISLLIGVGALVATRMPIAGYGPIPIALLGIGVGVLAFLASLVIRSWGSGTPVLGVLVSAGALALVGYNNGTLPAWWAKIHPAPPKPTPAVVAPAKPPVSDDSNTPHLHSIFDTGGGGGNSSPAAPRTQSPAPAITPAPAPAIATPAPVPVPALPPAPTLAQARADMDAATAAVERSLANDPAYVQAKSEVASADEKRKTALTESGPGSPQVQDASSQWLDAKSKLKKLVDSAAAKDSAFQAAQREMIVAEEGIRAGKSGSGK